MLVQSSDCPLLLTTSYTKRTKIDSIHYGSRSTRIDNTETHSFIRVPRTCSYLPFLYICIHFERNSIKLSLFIHYFSMAEMRQPAYCAPENVLYINEVLMITTAEHTCQAKVLLMFSILYFRGGLRTFCRYEICNHVSINMHQIWLSQSSEASRCSSKLPNRLLFLQPDSINSGRKQKLAFLLCFKCFWFQLFTSN